MHPVLQQVQWDAESYTKFLVQTKLFEAEKVFTDILCKIATDKLFAAVIKRTRTIGTRVFESGSKKFSIVRAHSIMHTRQLTPESLDIVFNICF